MTRVPWQEQKPLTQTERVMALMGVWSRLSGDSLRELRCVLNCQETMELKPCTPHFGARARSHTVF